MLWERDLLCQYVNHTQPFLGLFQATSLPPQESAREACFRADNVHWHNEVFQEVYSTKGLQTSTHILDHDVRIKLHPGQIWLTLNLRELVML